MPDTATIALAGTVNFNRGGMNMNIETLYEMQKELDARIIREKGLEGQDLFPNIVLALQVELGELANEWRGFKHWSNDRAPRTYEKKDCKVCRGTGEHAGINYEIVPCRSCGGSGTAYERNPLLEEYVDCLHFFLSIAVKNGWKDDLYVWREAIEDVQEKELSGGVMGAFLEIGYWLLKMYMEQEGDERFRKIADRLGISTKQFCFRNAWFVFVCLGVVGFGFTLEQIADAYVEKNRVNHERQENGY